MTSFHLFKFLITQLIIVPVSMFNYFMTEAVIMTHLKERIIVSNVDQIVQTI